MIQLHFAIESPHLSFENRSSPLIRPTRTCRISFKLSAYLRTFFTHTGNMVSRRTENAKGSPSSVWISGSRHRTKKKAELSGRSSQPASTHVAEQSLTFPLSDWQDVPPRVLSFVLSSLPSLPYATVSPSSPPSSVPFATFLFPARPNHGIATRQFLQAAVFILPSARCSICWQTRLFRAAHKGTMMSYFVKGQGLA